MAVGHGIDTVHRVHPFVSESSAAFQKIWDFCKHSSGFLCMNSLPSRKSKVTLKNHQVLEKDWSSISSMGIHSLIIQGPCSSAEMMSEAVIRIIRQAAGRAGRAWISSAFWFTRRRS